MKKFPILVATFLLPALGVWTASAAGPASAAEVPQRGYELVSPPDKGGADVGFSRSRIQASLDGDSVKYSASNAFAGAQGTGTDVDYLARRGGDGGWDTEPMTPPQVPNGGRPFFFLPWGMQTSDDLLHSVILQGNPALVAGAPAGQVNAYRRDSSTPHAPTWDLLTAHGPDVPSAFGTRPTPRDAVDDYSKILFESNDAQTPEAPAEIRSLYLWDRGHVSLAAVMPGGGVPDHGSQAGRAGDYNLRYDATNTISDDGQKIIFATPTDYSGPVQLYQREIGGDTVHISAPQRPDSGPDPAGTQDANFVGASADGSKVFFTSNELLTEDAATGPGTAYHLYKYESGLLTDITPGTGAVSSEGIVSMSNDGSYVYFVTSVRPTSATGPSDTYLYVWHDGTVRAIGPDPAVPDFGNIAQQDYNTIGNSNFYAKVTPDGKAAAFVSPGTAGGILSAYRYDYASNKLTCVSCPRDGSPQTSDATMSELVALYQNDNYRARRISDDGRRVMFQTDQALLPPDSNGVRDVYLWDDGKLELVSSGHDASNSSAGDLSASGDDAFFVTREQLSERDMDTALDLYDYRVGGGERQGPGQPAPCEGSGCQGTGTVVPAAPLAASVTFGGPGDPVLVRSSATTGKATVAKVAPVTGVRAKMRVKAPGKGALAVAGSGLMTVKKSVARAGSVTLTVSLTKRAAARLKQRHRLVVSARVAFRPAAGHASTVGVSLTFKQPKATKKGRS